MHKNEGFLICLIHNKEELMYTTNNTPYYQHAVHLNVWSLWLFITVVVFFLYSLSTLTSYKRTTIGLLVRCSICSLRRSSSLRQLSHVLMCGSPSGPRMELRLLLLPVRRRNPTSISWFWKVGSVSFSENKFAHM